jgi:hypothetical protein
MPTERVESFNFILTCKKGEDGVEERFRQDRKEEKRTSEEESLEDTTTALGTRVREVGQKNVQCENQEHGSGIPAHKIHLKAK